MALKRILFSTLVLASIFFAPFWLSAILAIAGMFIFPIYFEAIMLLFLSDLLYGIEKEIFFNLPYVGLLGSMFTLLIIEALKKKLRFYQ